MHVGNCQVVLGREFTEEIADWFRIEAESPLLSFDQFEVSGIK